MQNRTMRKLQSSSLVLSLLISITPLESTAASPIKTNGACKKVGAVVSSKNNKLVCKKVGKQLIWKKSLASLSAPIISAQPTTDFSSWEIKVLNYSQEYSGTTFSYSYAVNGGLWNLVKESKATSEILIIPESFRQIEFKVFFVDNSGDTRVSNIVSRIFGQLVNLGASVGANPTPTPSIAIQTQIFSLGGVQKMNLPTEYIGEKPYAKILFRWPVPNDVNIGGYIISYQDIRLFTPPCDLTKALCESPKRVDPQIYTIVIDKSVTDKIEIGNLIVDNAYEFKFCYVVGDIQQLKISGPLSCARGGQLLLVTNTEGLPEPPKIDVSSGSAKIIEIKLQSAPPYGYSVIVIVSGGKFGIGTQVASLTNLSKVMINADPGQYIVQARTIAPSGISSSVGSTLSVLVKP